MNVLDRDASGEFSSKRCMRTVISSVEDSADGKPYAETTYLFGSWLDAYAYVFRALTAEPVK